MWKGSKMLKPWKVLARKAVFDSKWVRIFQEKVRTASGKILDDYYIIDSTDVAIVIPVTTNGKVVIIREYKNGAKTVVTGFPAGYAEQGEPLETTAKRELEEETGYIPERLEYIGQALDSPTKQPNSKWFYIAWGCWKKTDPEHAKKEINELEEVGVADLNRMLLDGEMNDLGAQAAGLLAFSLGKLSITRK